MKYLIAIFLLTGCSTPVTQPVEKRVIIEDTKLNYYCPVSNLDDFHKEMYFKTKVDNF